MWFDILKNSKQVGRSIGSIDWEHETIPDNEEEDCLQWVKEFKALVEEAKPIILSDPTITEGFGRKDIEFFTDIEDVPNEIVCKVIQHIKDNPDNNYMENDWHKVEGADYGYRFTYYYGDGYQAVISIGKLNDITNHVVSPILVGISTDNDEPFDNFYRSILRRYKTDPDYGSAGNPNFLGDEAGIKLSRIIHKINLHFQKLWPEAEQYDRKGF